MTTMHAPQTAQQIDYSHLDRLQRRIMTRDSWVTESEFRAESEQEQISYYYWMCVQSGELAELI